ncbi:MAG: hypothetical protein HPY66_1794 [Firmicutes bacterium]|nr:hypothetical protein [Bacillota bacterium]MDI6707293.1 hypothetical protein [Bacillota bacterium]
MDDSNEKTKEKERIPLPKYGWGGSTPGWEENTEKVARLGEINKLLDKRSGDTPLL